MKARLTSFLITGMMLVAGVTPTSVQTYGESEYDSIIGTLPDWTPMSFFDAMEFYNEHGKSYLADNYICIVRPLLKDKKDDYTTTISGSMTNVNTPAGTGRRIYEIEIPEKPDPSDDEAVRAYEEYCEELGNYSYDYEFFEDNAEILNQYVFEVDMYRVLKGLDLTISLFEKDDSDKYTMTEEFSFKNPDGTTVQTDIYSWLPDCHAEYSDFFNNYGDVTVVDNYIVCRAIVNAGIGEYLFIEQNGEGRIKEAGISECDSFYLAGRHDLSYIYVLLYQPTADGKVDVRWMSDDDTSDKEPVLYYERNFEIKDDCSVILDHSPSRKGKTKFSFIDKDTGKLIDIPKINNNLFLQKNTDDGASDDNKCHITSNPFTVDSVAAYDADSTYSFSMRSNGGWYNSDEFEITHEDNTSVEVACYVKWALDGDSNGDGEFSIADAVLLQKWLLSSSDTDISAWKAADMCRDSKLDIFDLCRMKQKLIMKDAEKYVEPENRLNYGSRMEVVEDGLKLYLGPDEVYPVIDRIPAGTWIRENGFQDNNDKWVFTEYNGQYGWVRMYKDDDITHTVLWEPVADKPVIYLYPEKETDIHIDLELTESELSTTYPKYNNGWDVTAYPDGKLMNKADGTHHRYLFWDSVNCRTRFDMSKGFCVSGSDTESFLKEKLTYMGLNEDEMNEFIVYWLPRMEHNAYNYISFQGETYTDTAKLNITPTPDSLCRIFMTFVPLEKAVDTEPQQLESFERKGFTVVEWGGCEIR